MGPRDRFAGNCRGLAALSLSRRFRRPLSATPQRATVRSPAPSSPVRRHPPGVFPVIGIFELGIGRNCDSRDTRPRISAWPRCRRCFRDSPLGAPEKCRLYRSRCPSVSRSSGSWEIELHPPCAGVALATGPDGAPCRPPRSWPSAPAAPPPSPCACDHAPRALVIPLLVLTAQSLSLLSCPASPARANPLSLWTRAPTWNLVGQSGDPSRESSSGT